MARTHAGTNAPRLTFAPLYPKPTHTAAHENRNPVKTIPDAYTKNGYGYALVERTPRAAIYSQTHAATSRLCAYEVVRVRTREAQQTPNFNIEAGEYLPSTAEWGQHAKTVGTLAVARERLATFSEPPQTKRARTA